MPTDQTVQVLTPLRFLLTSGGTVLLAFGFVSFIWGVVNLVRPAKPQSVLMQCLLSLVPGIVAMVMIYAASATFCAMAVAETPPKPADFAAVAGSAMSAGFLGLASSVLPVFLGLCAFWRQSSRAVQEAAMK